VISTHHEVVTVHRIWMDRKSALDGKRFHPRGRSDAAAESWQKIDETYVF